MAKKIIFTEEDTNRIITLYKNRTSVGNLAKRFSVDPKVIKRVLKESKVALRGVESNGKIYTWNDHYFKEIDTENKAYWLGFLMADGFVTSEKVIGVKLALKDRKHLEKFVFDLDSDKPVYIFTSNENSFSGKDYQYCQVSITSKVMYQDLVNKGLTPRKSKTLEFPDIPEKLTRHFIRGYFDGDGSVYTSKQQGTCVNVLGTAKFLEIAKPLLAPNSESKIYNSRGISYITLGGNNARYALDYMYKDASVYLDRKYNRYCQSVSCR